MVEDLLEGEVAVITAAGRNIGAGIARTFADHGATTVINDIDEGRAQDTLDSLATDNGQAHSTLVCDATDPAAVADAADTIVDRYDRVDVLVNNAGYAVSKDVFDTSVEEWHQVLDLVLTSGFLWTKHVGKLIADGGEGGAVVNMASRLGSLGATDKVAYCASKGGVVNMTRQLALDLAEYGIRVNSISPGNTGAPVGRESGWQDFDTSTIPLGRLGRPEDVGNLALFLASDLSSYVTGEDVRIDGGKSL